MQIECPNCHHALVYADRRPSFCSECGCALPPSTAPDNIAETMIYASRAGAATANRDLSRTVGQYRLIQELGRGGMGVVYEGEHLESGRRSC